MEQKQKQFDFGPTISAWSVPLYKRPEQGSKSPDDPEHRDVEASPRKELSASDTISASTTLTQIVRYGRRPLVHVIALCDRKEFKDYINKVSDELINRGCDVIVQQTIVQFSLSKRDYELTRIKSADVAYVIQQSDADRFIVLNMSNMSDNTVGIYTNNKMSGHRSLARFLDNLWREWPCWPLRHVHRLAQLTPSEEDSLLEYYLGQTSLIADAHEVQSEHGATLDKIMTLHKRLASAARELLQIPCETKPLENSKGSLIRFSPQPPSYRQSFLKENRRRISPFLRYHLFSRLASLMTALEDKLRGQTLDVYTRDQWTHYLEETFTPLPYFDAPALKGQEPKASSLISQLEFYKNALRYNGSLQSCTASTTMRSRGSENNVSGSGSRIPTAISARCLEWPYSSKTIRPCFYSHF